jgi:hypothetical protein
MMMLFILAVCITRAQTVVTPTAIQQAGVAVITATDASFRSALVQIAQHPRSNLPPSILNSPHVIILENRSVENIARISVRYGLDFPGRPPAVWVHTLILTDLNGATGLRRGERVLVFSGVLQAGPGYARASEMNLKGQMSQLAQAKAVEISIDSILFEDGQFLGPDLNGESVRYIAQQSAMADMLSELRRLENDGPLSVAYLARLKELTPRPTPGLSVTDRSRDHRFHYDSAQRSLASFFAFKGLSPNQAIEYLIATSASMRDLKKGSN